MDNLPEELCELIINFLSINDKIILWSINKYFKSLIKNRTVNAYKLEYKLRLYKSVVYKTDYDLPYIMRIDDMEGIPFYKERRISKYYIVVERRDRCVSNCGRNRIGEVLYSKKREEKNIYRYNKKNVVYCKECLISYVE